MKRIDRIWFEGDYLYGVDEQGAVLKQSLLWYPRLRAASDEERGKQEFGYDGIHWRQLDEDVSFESFYYEEAEPSAMQRFFLTHPEIDVAGFAQRVGIKASLLRNYINGVKKPSAESERQVLEQIRSLGAEMAQVAMA